MAKKYRKAASKVVIFGLLGAIYGIPSQPAFAKQSDSQKLRSNIKSCSQILQKSIKFEEVRKKIEDDDYVQLRRVYRNQALYIDSHYYKTFGEVADAMATLRDNIWQVADRSADMFRALNSSQNAEEISGLDYAINQSMSYIGFDTVQFAETCRTLKGFKFKKDIFTFASLEVMKKFSESFGCISYVKSSEPAPFVLEWGQCQFDTTVVKLYNFKSESDLKSFIETIKSFGVTDESLIIKGLRIIAPDDTSKILSISENLGRN